MVGAVIAEYFVFVFMVIASVVIAHGGLMLVELLDAYFSTDKRRLHRGSPAESAPHRGSLRRRPAL